MLQRRMSCVPRPLFVSGLVVAACAAGPALDEPARVREPEAHAPSATPALPPCTWTLDACPEHIEWRFHRLLDARALGPDAHFIAIGGQAVGVSTGPSGSKSVVRVHMDDEILLQAERFRQYTLPDTVTHLIAVVDGETQLDGPATVYALACKQPETACSLWQVSSDEPTGSVLEEIVDSTFDGMPTALLFDPDQRQPCVVDKGLYCFDGAWHADIAPSTDGSDLRDVAMGSSMSLATAAHGVYWQRPRVAPERPALPWTRERVDADVTWTGASDIFKGYFLIGEQGAFMQSLPEGETLCAHATDFVASSGSVLVTQQGDVLFGLNASRCKLQDLGRESILDRTTAYCRASQNLWLMRERSIQGTTFCARL